MAQVQRGMSGLVLHEVSQVNSSPFFSVMHNYLTTKQSTPYTARRSPHPTNLTQGFSDVDLEMDMLESSQRPPVSCRPTPASKGKGQKKKFNH